MEIAREETSSFELRLWLALAVCRLLPPLTGGRLRRYVLRLGGIRVGERTVFAGRLWVAGGASPASRLTIGADCVVNDGCRFDTTAPITIGNDVYLGHDVAIITASHEIGSANRRAHSSVSAAVTIGDGTWVGTRAIVLPGASIGPGSVIGAGAVVTKPVAAGSLVGGVPARHLRHLD